MTNAPHLPEEDAALSPIKRALLDIRQLKQRLAAYESGRDEPVAIVGMACRLPAGICDPEAYWQFLREGRSAVGTVPPERWNNAALFDADPSAPGKVYTAAGAFLRDVDHFDPYFFGIPPREAQGMDPQQRLLLEIAWEALENAGIDPTRLDGTAAGVFIGLGTSDYAVLRARESAFEDIDAYYASGLAHSVAAGRISYFLGAQGPCVALDTACSSSLVAVHQACVSLQRRDCRMALAGGANLILAPDYSMTFCRARMLSPSGQCRTFDASADGYVRGEGVALVVLKRLVDAQADGDRILAVIRGSAVNQDGRSTGLTVPNGPAQEALIRKALQRAGLSPKDIQYVEAHGTGTPLGDPIEVQALATALGEERGEPLLIGSVKTNLGHLEAAAGIAGLLKVVLALQHGELPAHLHFTQPNPHIDWQRLPVQVTTSLRPWPVGRRIAGVSSFGFSGTNAHVIVEEAPPEAAYSGDSHAPALLVISAKDAAALRALAARYARYLREHPEVRLMDVARTAAVGRAHFTHRLALIANDTATAAAELDRFSRGEASTCTYGEATFASQDVAFLFTGQGSQYVGMARELYESEPVFRDALDTCVRMLDAELPRPLLPVIFDDTAEKLDQTQYTQPALFAIEFALAKLWRSWGVEPTVVLGHSVGEFAAACIAEVLSLEDAARLIAARARLMQSLPVGGGMLAVQGDDVGIYKQVLSGREDELAVAAFNAPGSLVLSGANAALERVAERLAQDGLIVQPLAVSHAFHSPLMEPIAAEFQRFAASITHRPPQLAWISNLTGDVLDWNEWSQRMDVYWRRHVREPVLFQKSIEAAIAQGVRTFIEVGPHPVLCNLGRATVRDPKVSWLASLKREQSAQVQMLNCLAQLYVRGVHFDWAAVGAHRSYRRVALPTYPFQRQRYWFTPRRVATEAAERSRWDRVIDAGQRQSAYVPHDLHLETFPEKWDKLATLARVYMVRALRELKVFTRIGERRTAADIIDQAGILPVYRKLVHRWLMRLTDAGLLDEEGGVFTARAPLPEVDVDGAVTAARHVFGSYPEMLEYVQLCGTKLVDVLTGRESALETLFPGGSNHITEGLYQRSAVARYYNAIVRSIVQAAAAVAGPLAILEIGAGTGGTTSMLLPELPADRTRYVFTDVSRLFLVQARQKFAAYSFVEYALLDIERAPKEQGFDEHSFDVVVAANVLHATEDLARTLRNAGTLLAPGGVLIMLETTDHPIWLDMSTGLIEGWQKFEDTLRESHPLLNGEQWSALLEECGFEATAVFPHLDSPVRQLGQAVIVARAPQAVGYSRQTSAARPSFIESPREPEQPVVDREQLLSATKAARQEMLEELVRAEVCAVLGIDRAHQPAPDQRLKEFGVDSLMAVELRNRLMQQLGLRRKLTATLIFDYPTVQAIAAHLDEQLLDVPSDAPARREEPARQASIGIEAIASMDDAQAEALLLEKLKEL